ncbi:MAG: hypothetical protein M1609_16945, partial [Firmicutes bacterium]|nr:hypothetical protein [Bacillota bacterium]
FQLIDKILHINFLLPGQLPDGHGPAFSPIAIGPVKIEYFPGERVVFNNLRNTVRFFNHLQIPPGF